MRTHELHIPNANPIQERENYETGDRVVIPPEWHSLLLFVIPASHTRRAPRVPVRLLAQSTV